MLRSLKQRFGKQTDNKDKEQQQGKALDPFPSPSSITLVQKAPKPPKAPRNDVSAHSRPRHYPNHESLRPGSLEDLIKASQRLADQLAVEDINPIPSDTVLDLRTSSSKTTPPSTDTLIRNLIRDNTAPVPSTSSRSINNNNQRDQRLNSVFQDNASAGPSAVLNTDTRHDPAASTAMASSSIIQPPGYRPASPSLLEGFDDMDTLPTSRPAQSIRQPSTPSVTDSTSAPTTTRFRYQLDPSLLSDFGEESDVRMSQPAAKHAVVSQPRTVHLASTRLVRRGDGALDTAILVRESSTSGTTQSQQQQQQSMRSNNPYVKVIEARQNAMTVAYLRNTKTDSGVDLPAFPADDVGFGQRYQRAGETTEVTNQRIPIEVLSGEQECIVCTDTKPVAWFPAISISKYCTHAPTTCLVCVAASIRSDLDNRLWNEIRCPECRGTLEYEDVQRYADNDTKTRYQDLTFRHAMSESPHFIWCTAGCGSGQIHESGSQQPIVACVKCGAKSCFHHTVPWHENLSCEEYDALLADPVNFRSRFEMENDEAATADDARRAQEDADRAYAQSLMAEEQRVVDEERRERARREEEAREARRREERAEQQRKLKEQRKRAAIQLHQEEQSQKTVARTTKPCPGCGWAIEKNAGCSHMTCIKCNHQFCWDCLVDHRQVLQKDNSAHQPSCPWHPSNLKDDGVEEEE